MKAIATVAVLGALAIPMSASADPNRYALSTTIAPGDVVALSVGAVPRGQFRFSVNATSSTVKNFVLTQKRYGKKEFTVLRVPSAPAYSACSGGSAAIYGPGPVPCSKLTTPAPAKARYTFRVRNLGSSPLKLSLVIKWQRLGSAQ